jgi:transcriptional regulator with XRE-family HTH domain
MNPAHPSGVVGEVGALLREERALRGLSLDEAARRANLSPEHLREVEEGYPKPDGGRTQGPTLAKLERVASIYGLHVGLVRSSKNHRG